MNLLKKQSLGTWLALGTIVLAIVAFIIYGVALKGGMDLEIANGSEMFYEANRDADLTMKSMVVTCGVIALVFMALALVGSQFKFEGVVGSVVNFLVGALRIVAPALLLCAMLYFVYGSFTGLGWTFFSNEELAIAPAAVTVGKQVITGTVFFALAAVLGTVAAFFRFVKKDAE